MRRVKSKAKLGAIVLAGVVGATATSIGAEDLYIQQDSVDITDKPNPLADIVQTVGRNTKVQVLAREDEWAKVQTSQAKGYVQVNALSRTQLAVQGGDANAAANLDQPLAGKGDLEPEAQQYSKDKNYDRGPLNKLIALEKNSDQTANEFDEFCKQGQVGKFKPH